MRVPFIKMHGLGNDFVVLDGRDAPLPAIDAAAARALADRHTGIGCDQLIVLGPSTRADFRLRIFNADGGEVEACGNASRAVGLLHARPARIETAGGTIAVEPGASGISVDMGEPRFEWNQIPLTYAMDSLSLPVAWDGLENPVAVNVGNPHIVFFVHDADEIDLELVGPMIENHPLFPERVNVSMAEVISRGQIRLRVWERGAGITQACGSAACATAVAASLRGLIDRQAEIIMDGGKLDLSWGADNHIIMTGGYALSYEGLIRLPGEPE